MRRAAATGGLTLALLALAGCGAAPGEDGSGHAAPSGKAATRGCPKHHRLTAYYLGPSFDGLMMSGGSRTCGGGPGLEHDPGLGSFVSYTYGECSNDSGEGCTPPLEVQSAPLCERPPGLYGSDRKRVRVRGVPASSFEGGRTLELYTGHTTVTIYGRDSRRPVRAARRLIRAPAALIPRIGHDVHDGGRGAERGSGGRLPSPSQRALHVKHPCDHVDEGTP